MNTKQNTYKTTIASIIGVFITLGLHGCIKDNSQLPDINSIPAIEIEAGDSKDISIEFRDSLKLTPVVKAPGSKNLGYRWTLTTTTDPNKLNKDTISKSAKLEYLMTREKSSSPYTLSFTVIDRDHGDLEYSTSWNVYVNGAIISGLLVADTEDEKTSNLTYIKSSSLSRSYSGQEKRLSDMLSVSPLKKVEGLISHLTYSMEGYSFFPHTNRLWATTREGKLILFDMDNFKTLKTSKDNQLFLYKAKPDEFKVQDILVAGPTLLASTNEGFYSVTPKAKVNQFTLPLSTSRISRPSKGLIAGLSDTGATQDIALWYDEESGGIVTLTKQDKWGQVFGLGELEKSAAFDPNNLSNREALAVEISGRARPYTFYALLKAKDKDEYEIYEVEIARKPEKKDEEKKGLAKGKYTFTPDDVEILKKAKSFFFAKNGTSVLYVVTDTDVYAFTFGGTVSTAKRSESLFRLPSKEKGFTMAKLFVQGEYSVSSESIGLISPKPAELPLNLQAVILVSETDEGKNTVRIIPVDKQKLSSGNLLTGEKDILTYENFNRVLDVIHIGQ